MSVVLYSRNIVINVVHLLCFMFRRKDVLSFYPESIIIINEQKSLYWSHLYCPLLCNPKLSSPLRLTTSLSAFPHRFCELRQPRQRPSCHPINERLPDRYEETQSAAEEAKGRQPPLLAPAGHCHPGSWGSRRTQRETGQTRTGTCHFHLIGS